MSSPLPSTESKGRIYAYSGMTFEQAVALIEAEKTKGPGVAPRPF